MPGSAVDHQASRSRPSAYRHCVWWHNVGVVALVDEAVLGGPGDAVHWRHGGCGKNSIPMPGSAVHHQASGSRSVLEASWQRQADGRHLTQLVVPRRLAHELAWGGRYAGVDPVRPWTSVGRCFSDTELLADAI